MIRQRTEIEKMLLRGTAFGERHTGPLFHEVFWGHGATWKRQEAKWEKKILLRGEKLAPTSQAFSYHLTTR